MKPTEIKEISEKDYADSFQENYLDEEPDPREVDDEKEVKPKSYFKYRHEDFFDAI